MKTRMSDKHGSRGAAKQTGPEFRQWIIIVSWGGWFRRLPPVLAHEIGAPAPSQSFADWHPSYATARLERIGVRSLTEHSTSRFSVSRIVLRSTRPVRTSVWPFNSAFRAYFSGSCLSGWRIGLVCFVLFPPCLLSRSHFAGRDALTIRLTFWQLHPLRILTRPSVRPGCFC